MHRIIFLVLIRTRQLSSCHFLGPRALLFRLFTAISSPGVSRSTLPAVILDAQANCRGLPWRIESQQPLVPRPGVVPTTSRLGTEVKRGRLLASLGEFCGSRCSHDDYIPPPCPLTHFAPSSVILVVPDGIDSLRNAVPRPPPIRSPSIASIASKGVEISCEPNSAAERGSSRGLSAVRSFIA